MTTSVKSEAMQLLESINGKLDQVLANQQAAKAAPPRPRQDGTFPNYGKAKGLPIKGASEPDLTYYLDGAKRTLADPSKERWHAKERELKAAIEAEMRAQGIPVPGDDGGPPPHTDADAPF